MNRILLALVCVFLSGLGYATSEQQARSSRAVISLESMGARPNDPNLNSRLPFQKAMAKLQVTGGGILSISPGDYYLNFPDIASDVDSNDAKNAALLKEKDLKKEKIILVPPGVLVQGTLDESGNPRTRIHWNAASFPILSFINSDGSGVKDIAFVFDGLQPQFFPWSQEKFLEEVGYKSRWLGGPYEISTVIYAIGSSNLRFENISFRSGKKPADNEHTLAFGIVLKGKGPVTQPDPNVLKALPFGVKIPGGGLSECASNNVFRSLRFQDYVMGILASGQCSPVFENINGNYRGSWYRSFNPSHETGTKIKNIGPPGHLIYLSFQTAYDMERSQDAPTGHQVFHSTTRNQDVVVRNIKEGPQTLSNVNALGTLALKNIDHGMVANVVSQHPAGLIQSMIDAHDVELDSLSWSSDVDICTDEHSPASCGIPVLDLEPGPVDSDSQFSSKVRFRNISLRSPSHPATFKVSQESGSGPLSRDISVDGLKIESDAVFPPNQASPRGIITLRSISTHFTNVQYKPLIPADAPPDREKYSALIQSRSSNTTVEMMIEVPNGTPDDAPAYKCVIEKQQGQSQNTEEGNKCQIVRRNVK
jgi:hypothetical protein